MAKARSIDVYANRSFAELTLSAADTITFQQIRFAVGTFQGIGLLLHRVEYHLRAADYQGIVATADRLMFGLTVRDDITTLDPTNQGIISKFEISVNRNATAEAIMHVTPIVHDFTELPEGGLLIPPNPLFLAGDSSGIGSAAVYRAVLYYTFMQLDDRQSIELLQTLLPGNV